MVCSLKNDVYSTENPRKGGHLKTLTMIKIVFGLLLLSMTGVMGASLEVGKTLETIPVGSEEAYKSYLTNKASGIWATISAINPDGTVNYIIYGEKPKQVSFPLVDSVAAIALRYASMVTNYSGQIASNATYDLTVMIDDDNYSGILAASVFRWEKTFSLEGKKGAWKIPSDLTANIDLPQLTVDIPFAVPNVAWVQVIFGADGFYDSRNTEDTSALKCIPERNVVYIKDWILGSAWDYGEIRFCDRFGTTNRFSLVDGHWLNKPITMAVTPKISAAGKIHSASDDPPFTSVGITLRGSRDALMTLESTSDFKSWKFVTTVRSAQDGSIEFIDESQKGPVCFYRAYYAGPD